MQCEFRLGPIETLASDESWLPVGAVKVRVQLIRHRRAKRYVLRLGPDGQARLTIPRGGSAAEALRFARRNAGWLEKQLLRHAAQPERAEIWLPGVEILFRGELLRLAQEPSGKFLRLGAEQIEIKEAEPDLRPLVERHLLGLAKIELPARTLELAALHQLPVRKVTVRNQRSRWGSCSRQGTISLNWRLVQTPLFVRDYIILHELAHLLQMNHSRRFWREVGRLCPNFVQAERWLKKHAGLLK